MSEVVDRLAALPLFAGLNADQIATASSRWEHRQLSAGSPLWWHGDMASEMAVVLEGSLEIRIAERGVGTVSTGELVGEAAAWSGGRRTASVRAAQSTSLAVLTTEDLPALRAEHEAVYDRLLSHALDGLAQRIRQVDREIARLAYGEGSAPGRKAESVFGKLWRRLTTSSAGTPPPARQALRAMPAMTATHADTLRAIEVALTPHHLNAGTTIFLEGDPGESIFVVADGCVDVIRHVRDGRGERMASLFPGALFGTGSLLLKERRNASCVASETTACWVYEMNQSAFKALKGEPGRVWRESILEALRFQISRADEQLVKLMSGSTSAGSTDYERIRAGLI